MFILSPLRSRSIRLLWGGQVLSAIGDEIYKVALVWLAIDLSGKDAGFLVAVEAGAILFLGILGGTWAERFDHRKVMIAADIIRAVALVSLPLFAWFMPLSMPMLICVAIVVSGLMAFFDPALQETLPEIIDDEETLHATNGLMEATRRIARVIGPGVAGLMNAVVPLIQFFSINAASFLLSALSISLLNRHAPRKTAFHQSDRLSTWQGLKHSFGLALNRPILRYMVLGCVLTWSVWSLCFSLGLALLVNEQTPGNITRYGFLVCAYGVGNLASNLFWGSRRIRRPQRTTFVGTGIIGLGFILLALAPTYPLQMLAAAFCAIGGPMEDLSFLTVLQAHYRGNDIARIFRLRLMTAFGGIFVIFLLSPLLFRLLPTVWVIGMAGSVLLGFGIWGLFAFRNDLEHHSSRQHDAGKNSDLVAELGNTIREPLI